jgi:predicted nucleotidyltransferase
MAVIEADVERRGLAAIRTLARLGDLRAAYIFGSQAEGRADSWSDIDIAAFLEGIENWDIQRRAQTMALVMEEAGSNVEAHLLPASDYEKPEQGSFAEHILKHGICIFRK